jgi:hypothetical protein
VLLLAGLHRLAATGQFVFKLIDPVFLQAQFALHQVGIAAAAATGDEQAGQHPCGQVTRFHAFAISEVRF